MKQLIKFLVITALLVIGCNYYFEYAVNRDLPTVFSYPLAVVMLIIVAFYFRYLVKTIINLLNFKK